MPVECVFFDLDYTLYDMQQYLRGAFRDVAQHVASRGGDDAEPLFASLWRRWRQVGSGYGRLFDDWLEAEGRTSQPLLDACLAVYRAHAPTLRLYPGAEALLTGLRRRYRLGLISDGHLHMQQSKLEALGLARGFDVIVYTAALGASKPDPAVFREALRRAGVAAERAVHVGDHPTRDVAGARRVGMRGVRVLTGEYRELPDDPELPPNAHVERLAELCGWLAAAEEARA